MAKNVKTPKVLRSAGVVIVFVIIFMFVYYFLLVLNISRHATIAMERLDKPLEIGMKAPTAPVTINAVDMGSSTEAGPSVDAGVRAKSSSQEVTTGPSNKAGITTTGTTPCNVAKDAAQCLGPDTVLLIICANRPDYLKRTLEAVLRYHPRFP